MNTLFANLIYLVLVYYLWKAIYDSSGTDVVNGMTFSDTMIFLLMSQTTNISKKLKRAVARIR